MDLEGHHDGVEVAHAAGAVLVAHADHLRLNSHVMVRTGETVRHSDRRRSDGQTVKWSDGQMSQTVTRVGRSDRLTDQMGHTFRLFQGQKDQRMKGYHISTLWI